MKSYVSAVCHDEVTLTEWLEVINLLEKADIYEELCKAVNILFCSLPDIIWKADICVF